MANLSPLHAAFDDLEKAVAGVAEKISNSVSADVSQDEVNQLVDRAKGYAERLVGLAPAAETPANAAPSAPVEPAPSNTGSAPTWTPENPSA